ncbi:hypothetical protein DUI87_03372 [Hirundo rustica rustica]|uniref:Reverse transcriptase domain-containing protein n=1 Tax=Hirundo rustica rustica TaxID=333673 RepID=A0A3M0LL05_HIRRU|nr:hypothetical protein DUI87_03372 [Hirundo rustica rustica]
MGQTLKEFSDPIAWDFPREQIQNPAEVGKYLKENCYDDSKEKKLIAISWALAYAYCMLLDTEGQQVKAGGQGDKSAATPVMQAAGNTSAIQVVAKPDNEPKSATEPESEPEPAAKPYRTTPDVVIPIHKMICELESQGVVSKTHSPFNSPIWPVRKSEEEWRLTVDYRALNEVTPLLL